MGAAPVSKHLEGLFSVEVVSVDDGEGLLDDVLCHENGVGCAPRLYAVFGDGERCGDLVKFLGYEHKLQRSSVAALDTGIFLLHVGLHVGFERLADNINHLAETGLHGVVD